MLAARCLMLNSYLIDRYFSVHFTTNLGDVNLSTNVVYGRDGLWVLAKQIKIQERRKALMYPREDFVPPP